MVSANSSIIQFICQYEGTRPFVYCSFKYFFHNGRFFGVHFKVFDRLVFLIQTTFLDSPIAKPYRPTCVKSISPQLIQPGFNSHRCFPRFTFTLPITDIVDQ